VGEGQEGEGEGEEGEGEAQEGKVHERVRRACAAATGSPPAMRRFETSMYQSAYSSHRNERTWLGLGLGLG